jgi:hypothetical protein
MSASALAPYLRQNFPMQAFWVTLRVLLGVFGGYAISAASSAALALALSEWAGFERAESTVLCAMLGFAFYLFALLWAFTTPRLSQVAFVLLAIFWMGTLSVSDREIDRWMMPHTRLPPSPALSLDAAARTAAPLAAGAKQWSLTLPSERTPPTACCLEPSRWAGSSAPSSRCCFFTGCGSPASRTRPRAVARAGASKPWRSPWLH